MTTPLNPAEAAATPPRRSPRTGEDGRPITEGHGDGRHRPGSATSRRRNVSGSKRICARTETNHPGEGIGAGKRATVAAMLGSPAPIQPGLGLHAARGEFVRLRAMGEISAREPAWLDAANPAPRYLLSGDAVVLSVLPHAQSWVATTCATQRTLTPTRREAQSAQHGLARRAQMGRVPHPA